MLKKSKKACNNFDADFTVEAPVLTPAPADKIAQVHQVRHMPYCSHPAFRFDLTATLSFSVHSQEDFEGFSFVNPDFRETA